MEKQIEEMAKVLDEIQEFGINRPRDEQRYPVLYPSNKEIADHLISKGWCKASDVAREIFAEIEKIIEVDKFGEAKFDIRELYKIEQKYESEGKK